VNAVASERRSKRMTVREKTIRSYRVRETLSNAVSQGTVIPAAEFKANCLALMVEVRDKGTEFVITKHNHPVARLVPVIEEAGRKFIGRTPGMIEITGDIVGPVSPDWDEGADI
jgi:prevent-host-death family protein